MKKMKTNSFVFLFVLLFLFLLLKHSSGSIFKEKLKDLMDISFECKEPICEENFNILEVVDCAVQEARWDYIVNVGYHRQCDKMERFYVTNLPRLPSLPSFSAGLAF